MLHLAFVCGGSGDGCASWCSPFVDATIWSDVPQSVRMHLEMGIVIEQLNSQRRTGGQETTIICLFNLVTDRKHLQRRHESNKGVKIQTSVTFGKETTM